MDGWEVVTLALGSFFAAIIIFGVVLAGLYLL